jgi:hypothetical protein
MFRSAQPAAALDNGAELGETRAAVDKRALAGQGDQDAGASGRRRERTGISAAHWTQSTAASTTQPLGRPRWRLFH